MQFKELANLAKLIQATVEHHYGLYGKLRVKALLPTGEEEDLNQWETISYNCSPAYCSLFKELGIGLFGAHVVLYSPTGRPLGIVGISWRFQVDDEGFRPKEGTIEATLIPQGYWIPCENMTTIRPETNISKVEVAIVVQTTCQNQEETTDLRFRVREKLKENYSQVAFNLTHFGDGLRRQQTGFKGRSNGVAMTAGFPWW